MTKTATKDNVFHFGIDVAKEKLDIHCLETGQDWVIENSLSALKKFNREARKLLASAYICVDTTGGYELVCCDFFCKKDYKVYQAHSRRVKDFIRSMGQEAKTDRLDAIMLARYGKERKEILRFYKTKEAVLQELRALVTRREQLVKMQTAEKNRKSGPTGKAMQKSFETILKAVKKEIEAIEEKIEICLENNEDLKKKGEILMAITGIGVQTRNILLAYLPEIGELDRKRVASLGGLAPFAKDSGTLKGRRHVKCGRQSIKRIMFTAAMSAVKHDKKMKEFHQNLINKGKMKMVALTASARKLLTIANAKVRDNDFGEAQENIG